MDPIYLSLLTILLIILLYGSRRLSRLSQMRKETTHVAKAYLGIINQYVITSRTDLDGIITDVSDAFCEASGFHRHELLGKSHAVVRHPDTANKTYASLWDSIASGKDWQGEMCNQRKDGSTYWVQASITADYDLYGNKIGYIAVHQDITDHKMVIELSIRDALTGLYNRRHFNHYFDQLLQDAHDNEQAISLMIFDVDNFKKYNDTYGHQKGDDVLKETAAALQYCTQEGNAACFRLGGEEFAIVVLLDEDAAVALAEKVRAEIEALNIEHINNAEFGCVTTSVGVYTHPYDGFAVPEADELFRIADQCLYRAKESGRNQVGKPEEESDSIELF